MSYLSTVPSDDKTNAQHGVGHDQFVSTTVYGSALAAAAIPRFELGEDEMPARTAMRMVHDELLMVND
jgi:glutamate decarboxylase